MVGTQSETVHHTGYTVISVLHCTSKISTVGALNEQKHCFHVPPLSQTVGNECISSSLQVVLRLRTNVFLMELVLRHKIFRCVNGSHHSQRHQSSRPFGMYVKFQVPLMQLNISWKIPGLAEVVYCWLSFISFEAVSLTCHPNVSVSLKNDMLLIQFYFS